MASDMFIQIKGIDGDSSDSKHAKWIEVLEFQHGVAQMTGGSASAQGTHAGGRADHQDFSFGKKLDSASPTLYAYCCDGKPIEEITFECCRAMGEKTVFYKIVFKESIIASVTNRGSRGEDLPSETVTIRYGEILWEYTPTDAKGGGKKGAAIKAGWSTFENKPV